MYSYNNVPAHIQELIKDCIKKCEEVGIPISKNIDFFMMKGERTYGDCTKSSVYDECKIRISKYLVDDKDICNTIFHELLHSCRNCHGHGGQWQMYGKVIERNFGYPITRCSHQTTVNSVASSRRKYYTREEYLDNKDILIALRLEGSDKPLWYVKKNSAIVRRVEKGVCRTAKTKQKVIIFKEVK